MVLLISGKQGSGKTTLAKNVCKAWQQTKNNRAILVNFADPLYDMHNFIIGYLKDHGIERPLVKDRPLLQLLGTEWGRRTVSENIWVDLLKAKIKKAEEPGRNLGQNQLFIVGDCRFRNEFDAFPDAVRIRLECTTDLRRVRCEQWRETDNHASEIDLDGYAAENKFDLNVYTDDMNAEKTSDLVMRLIEDRAK